ncbi:MAG: metal-sensing transcriptional repressor, partial [Bdellovibrionales bacterium]|nr:metal-sensing transcriptional repressor [Bdellovibrionales bacterium]
PMNDLKGAPHGAQIKQLKRIEGQVRGIINMVEEQRY